MRVLSAQLAAPNLSPAELLTDLVSHKIDVAVITVRVPSALSPFFELAPEAARRPAIGGLRNYRVLRSPEDASPWVLFVRNELSTAPNSRNAKQQASARVRIGACELTVQPLSLPSLLAYGQREVRAARLRALRNAPRNQRSVWLGQLGSSPSASDVGSLLDAQELRDGRLGYGRLPSWPATLAGLGIPLEHVLVHGWLRVIALSMDEPLASQAQRTLRATVELTEPGCRATP